MELITYLPFIFFVIAFTYSTVGFGGGSSYIALLLLAGMAVDELKLTALLCNITVVSIASFFYFKNKMINWKKLLPIIILSVPFAYLGAQISVSEGFYKKVAGFILLLASILMLIRANTTEKHVQKSPYILGGLGGGIGFLSGFIGIGGGIFLSPVMHLMKWGKAKEISAICSVFILVNSISGILGQREKLNLIDWKLTIFLIIGVLIGGLLGNQLSIRKLEPKYIRYLTAILVGYVGIRILII